MHISAVSVLVAALLASTGVDGARGAGLAHPMNAGSHHASNGARHILRRSVSESSEGAAPAPTQTPFNNRKPGVFGNRVKPVPAPVAPKAPASESGDSESSGGQGAGTPPAPAPVVPESESSESGDSSHEGGGSKPASSAVAPREPASSATTTTTTTKSTATSKSGGETSTATSSKSSTKSDGTSTKASESSTVKVYEESTATATSTAPLSDGARSTEGGSGGSPSFNPAWAVAPAAVAGAAGLFLYRRRRATDAGTMEWPEEGVQKNALYEDTATHENALYADNLQG